MRFKLGLWIALAVYGTSALASPSGAQRPLKIEVFQDIKHDTSPPLRELLQQQESAAAPNAEPSPVFNLRYRFEELYGIAPRAPQSAVQRAGGNAPAPAPIVSFNGIGTAGSIPPDTTGDVSPTHYFQWVNTRWALFNKATGAVISGPNPGNSFFAGFGGLCQTTNRGDPLVLWDDAAQRWVVSQFAFTSTTAAPFLQCVAVSQTSDPLGSYHRYAFSYPNFNDYGKMGIWRTADASQNAYLFTMHEFLGSFQGGSYAVGERDAMLNGQTARFIRVSGGTIQQVFGALPFHLEGNDPMPAGACPVFVHYSTAGNGYRFWDLCIDWNAGTATLGAPALVSTLPYTLGIAGIAGVPQRDTATQLDNFSGNLMYMASVRAFPSTGPNEAYGAISHVVDAGATLGGARWVQFGFSAAERGAQFVFSDGFEGVSAPNSLVKRVINEGTYAPGTVTRWMSSINVDQSGNLGIGYTASGTTTNPEIRINGRDRNDPAGQLLDEQVCTPPNTGAQTGGIFPPRTEGRWGDYSTTSVDPSDNCTFWHTNEYFATTSSATWSTRICSFKFPSCGTPDFVLESRPVGTLAVCGTDAADPTARVRLAAFSGYSGTAALSASGFPVGVVPAFNPLTLGAGATSTVTLVGARTVTPGTYNGTVTAIDGALSRSTQISFGVSATAAPAPVLSSPTNAATGASIRPILRWAAAPGATGYTIDLATNAGFSPILETGTSTTNSFTPTTLLTVGQQYFWRVRSQNFCGTGGLSTTFSFTTGAPGLCPSGTTANAIFQDDVSGDAIAWTTDNNAGDPSTHWQKTVPAVGTGLTTRSWVALNSAVTGDQRLVSPSIVLPSSAQSPLTLAFDAFHRYEEDGPTGCWDGALVEASTNGGSTWIPLGNARTLTDVYPGTLSGSPAAGLEAWCRQPAGGQSVRTVFTLDGFAGQTVRFRFRSVSDSNTVGTAPNGWAIDNIQVQGCQ